MNDPAIGSSSPHWACIMSAGRIAKPAFDFHENNGNVQGSNGLEMPTKSTLNHGGVIGNSGGGQQMSPYAPVFYPMGSYAAQLLAQEQAAQMNSRSGIQRNGDSQPYPNPNHMNNGSKSGQCYGQMQQQQQQQIATYPSGEECAIGSFEGNCNSFGLGMTMKSNGGGGGSNSLAYRPYPVQNQNSSEPNCHDHQSSGLPVLSTSLPINAVTQGTTGHGIEVPVPPRTADIVGTGPVTASTTEWAPYSYATKPVISKRGPAGPTYGSDSSTPSNHNNAYPNNSSSSNSCPDLNPNGNNKMETDFPSFDEFAKQLDNCDISRNEFLATLRNLMIRANDMMMPLLRGPFSHMTPIQMATYTTAILNTPPLHPSLFMSPDNRRFLSSNSWKLPPYHPHSLTPQDLAKINPRPVLINASTQTDCLRNYEMPLNAAWVTAANLTDGMMGAGQMPPQPAQFGFWGRTMVPMHPHTHPHAHPQAPHAHSHQMAHPLSGALRFPESSGNNNTTGGGGGGGGTRYGFRIGPYSPMPCRYGPIPGGRNAKHGHSTEHYGNNINSGNNNNNSSSNNNGSNNGNINNRNLYGNGVGPSYRPRGQRIAGTSYAAAAAAAAAETAATAAATAATKSTSVVTNSDDNASTDMSINFIVKHNHQKQQPRGVKRKNNKSNNNKNNKSDNSNNNSNNNTSSSSNISSSSSGNCFPMLGISRPHQQRRRRSTTTECSSEEPEEVNEQETIEEEEINEGQQKNCDRGTVNKPIPNGVDGPRPAKNSIPALGVAQLTDSCDATQSNGIQDAASDSSLTVLTQQLPALMTHAQNRQFHANPTAAAMMMGDSPISASISNIFMRPTGPMMPMLHERSPLPPIVFDVNTNIASAAVMMPSSHAGNMMSHHHIMNAMGMTPMMAMLNPNLMPQQTVNTIRNMNHINLNVNANGNAITMPSSNTTYLSEFDGLNSPGALPTLTISDITSNQQSNGQADVTEEPTTHQPSYASLLQ